MADDALTLLQKYMPGRLKNTSRPEEIIGECPLCGHKRYAINIDKGLTHCRRANCGWSPRLWNLLWQIKAPVADIKEIKRELDRQVKEAPRRFKGVEYSDVKMPSNVPIWLPRDTTDGGHIAEKLRQRAFDYLTQVRGIDARCFHMYDIRVGLSDKWGSRIIFPAMNPSFYSSTNKKIVYFSGRTIKPNIEPKALNAADEKLGAVFGLHLAQDFLSCYVCEGPISALSVGGNAVATFGSQVTKMQMMAIKKVGFERVVIVPDKDAYVHGSQLAEKMADLDVAPEIRVVRLRLNDPNDYIQKGMQKELQEDLDAHHAPLDPGSQILQELREIEEHDAE